MSSCIFFFSSRRRHTRSYGDWSSDVCSSDLDDSKYHYRDVISASFREYGVDAAPTKGAAGHPRAWEPPDARLDYSKTHYGAMRQDRDEIFRFVWENREGLGLCDEAYTRVQSVRPCLRLSSECFLLQETVAEYVQILNLMAGGS